MTLVVSEVTAQGLLMVGDSALSIRDESQPDNYRLADSKGAKIQYSERHNIGFAAWGYFRSAGPRSPRVDEWLVDFIERLPESTDLEEVGTRLAEELNEVRNEVGILGEDGTRGGFHLAGYHDGLPRLWHVHTGHASEDVHELHLYKDFPEGQSEPQVLRLCDSDWQHFLERGEGGHLRNGYHIPFANLFDSLKPYLETLRAGGVSLPAPGLEGRVDFYKLLIRFIAETLVAARAHPGVGGPMTAIAFTEEGIVLDERSVPESDSDGEEEAIFVG